MKIKDVMTSEPRTCTPETSLACAAQLMLEGDCGTLPIVQDGKIVGIVTDRDMYIALATRNKLASQISLRPAVGCMTAENSTEAQPRLLLSQSPSSRGFGASLVMIPRRDPGPTHHRVGEQNAAEPHLAQLGGRVACTIVRITRDYLHVARRHSCR